MVSFSYRVARSRSEAVSAAAGGARYIAGGTNLVDLMREEIERPQSLIDINQLRLRGLELEANGLVVGALARMSEVADHPIVAREHPLIVESLLEGASPQLRNAASIGGNLLQRVRCPYFRTLDAPCNKRQPGSGCAAVGGVNYNHAIFGTSEHCIATHPSDLAVVLVALDATVRVDGIGGTREFPVEELYRLPGETPHLEHTIEPDELIVQVVVPLGVHARRARYVKVRDRASYDFALVSVAAALEIEDTNIRDVRICAGGVGVKPWRFRDAERALRGRRADRKTWEEGAALAVQGAKPASGNAYKVELLRRTIIRALELAEEMA
jgi:xanthine dehydrogenase YagS FAD-binding subunit